MLNLNAAYEQKTLTWRALADAWREAFSDSQEDAQVKTMQNILDTRAEKEAQVEAVFPELSMSLYHTLENKNSQEILAFIREFYLLDLQRFFEKSGEMHIAENLRNELEECLRKDAMLDDTLHAKNDAEEKRWTKLFAKIHRWDDLLDFATLQTPKEDSPYDQDQLYDALMALQVTNAVNPKKKTPADPKSRISSCIHCWRPALVKTAKKAHECRCPIHSYEPIDGRPARKQAYQRVKEVDEKLKEELKKGLRKSIHFGISQQI